MDAVPSLRAGKIYRQQRERAYNIKCHAMCELSSGNIRRGRQRKHHMHDVSHRERESLRSINKCKCVRNVRTGQVGIRTRNVHLS